MTRIAMIGCGGLLLIGGALPARAATQPPGRHVAVIQVTVDAAASTLAIAGEAFDFGNQLKVTLGTIGDVTPLCSLQLVPSHLIECDFSSVGGLPPAGDYLLTVATGPGQSQHAEYDLTIVGAAPAGPPPIVGFYSRSAVASAVAAPDPQTISTQVLCDAGDVVVGGGFDHQLTPGGHSTPQNIVNKPNAAGTGWMASINRIMPAGSTLTVWARCADLTP